MKKVIFVRVPRTASTNFTGILEKIYKPNMIRDLVWQDMPAKERTKKLKRGEYFYDFDNMKMPDKKIRTYDCIEGHFYAKKYESLRDEFDFVTFLRDPLERVISHFNIVVSRQDRLKLDIRKFAEIYKNFHKSLLGDDLSLYKFIGITEMFNFSINQFYKIYNTPQGKKINLKKRRKIRRGSTKKRAVSEKDKKFIRKINKEDYEMYNEVKHALVIKQQMIKKQVAKKQVVKERPRLAAEKMKRDAARLKVRQRNLKRKQETKRRNEQAKNSTNN